MHEKLSEVTERIIHRSRETRQAYLSMVEARKQSKSNRDGLSAGNKAHAFAACPAHDKKALLGGGWPNIAIVTAYNDMLSAHQPYKDYPDFIRDAAREFNATAQVAGGVPAMCDGVTQGQPGMELSLFSRDVIAMSTAVALSHNTFDGALYLGICDKIVPGLLIGALQFGHLPAVFVPSGPMPSGLPNREKARIRQLFAEGKVGREQLLEAECASYHSPGTCTFYGTANTNQMLMEFMGLHLPGASFVAPSTPLRDALTREATKRVIDLSALGQSYTPLGEMMSEKVIVNAMVGLAATGGSTNLTLHLPAIARAAGIEITWQDFDELSAITPLLTRVYPNGQADINHFHAAGGVGLVMGSLMDAGLLHTDVQTVFGTDLTGYRREPVLDDQVLTWRDAPTQSGDTSVIAHLSEPFEKQGGLRLLTGDLGRAIAKLSAVQPDHRCVEAPACVFDDQDDVLIAFEKGDLDRDCVVVLRFQGPSANGMPELHKLTPALSALIDRGHKVALITDGRMSGASGKVLAAVHMTPEAIQGGALSKIQNGDIIRFDGDAGTITLVDCALDNRDRADKHIDPVTQDIGRGLFSFFRAHVGSAENGGSPFFNRGE